MRKRLYSLLAALAAALVLTACTNTNTPSITVPKTPEEIKAAYEKAVSDLQTDMDLIYSVKVTKSTTLGENSFVETFTQTVSYVGRGTDNMMASGKETLAIDDYASLIQETYKNGTVYSSINDGCFTDNMSGDAFLARYMPAVLVNPALYETMTTETNGPAVMVTFSNASGIESFVDTTSTIFSDVKATATFNALGHLTESNYDVTYAEGSATIHISAAATINMYTTPTIELPSDTSAYLPIDDLDALKRLELGFGYMQQATNLSSQAFIYMEDQSVARIREETVQLTMSGQGSGLDALVITDVKQTDNDRRNETSSYLQKEVYKDGIFTLTKDDQEPTQDSSITAPKMQTYCNSLTSRGILPAKYVSGVTITEYNDSYLYQFTVSEASAKNLRRNICKSLYDDENMLEEIVDEWSTKEFTAYISVDKTLGIPLSSGYTFITDYRIDDTTYQMSARSDQTYTLPGLSATAPVMQNNAQ